MTYTQFEFSKLIELAYDIGVFFSGIYNFLSQETLATLLRSVPLFGDFIQTFPFVDSFLDNFAIANLPLITIVFGYAVFVAIAYYILRGIIGVLT